jgi:serine/threonine protein kinase/Tol biopolymer transport system component
MNLERWQQIENLYHAAMQLDAARRGAFLQDACAGDDRLRQEVESLICSSEQSGDFLERPAFDLGLKLLSEEPAELMIGRTLGAYQILSVLGRGGMGEVFLALDTRLGRRVALKLLPASFAASADRVIRFRREAHAASNISHPNAAYIYEIGEADGRHFITMEYVEGTILRHRIQQGPLDLQEALGITAQVASALAAAHAIGIVHRDIKPENIMLRPDGYVKVLDFGLAKLTEKFAGAGEADPYAPTRAMLSTGPGVVMGTVSYMSPEQARGLQIDARTDIWSLGVVLYEMVAGRRPFEGETASDVIVSILDRNPVPIVSHPGSPLGGLQQILDKALCKEAAGRYQTAREMAHDLKRLSRKLEIGGALDEGVEGALGWAASGTQGGRSSPDTAKDLLVRTDQIDTAHPTAGAESIAAKIMRHRKGATAILALLFAALATGAYGLYRLSAARSKEPFQAIKLARLTNIGKARDAAISPDGRFVVYVVDESGQQSLWLRQTGTATNIPVVPPAATNYAGLTFSPDSNFVYYVRFEKPSLVGTLYQMPVLGGLSKKLVAGIDSAITLSPDGRQLAFMRNDPARGETALVVANIDGTNERQIAARRFPNFYTAPAWSPSGKTLITSALDQTGGRRSCVVEINVASGQERRISQPRWVRIKKLVWAGSDGLVMVADEQGTGQFQIWHIPYPQGEARKITNDLHSYASLSATADARTLVTVQEDTSARIWTAPVNSTASARQITSGKVDGIGVVWTRSGKIVYRSLASGNPDLWIMEADGSSQKQLTFDSGANYYPGVSPDDRYIVFVSDRQGKPNIWRMDIDGANQKQLTFGDDEEEPVCTPDGRWVVYTSYGAGAPTLWKVPVEGGDPIQLTRRYSALPAISPDGKLLACWYRNEEKDLQWAIAVIPFGEALPARMFDIPISEWASVQWWPGERAFTYIDTQSGVSNIWSQPLDGNQPRQLTDFRTDKIFWFDWSHDGKRLAVARGAVTNDVIMISDAR